MYEIFINDNQSFLSNVMVAENFKDRLIGLMFKKSIESGQGLYIPKCKSIHSFFMKFSIDVLFTDKNFNVVKHVKGLKPWRVTPPVFSAFGVIEMKEGTIEKFKIENGSKLILVKKHG